MEKGEDPSAQAVAFRLKHKLGPYAGRYAEFVLGECPPYDEYLEEMLTKEWDGAVPDDLLWGTAEGEVSRAIMGVLFTMLEFAVEEAKDRKDYDARGEGILSYYVEPYYDDRSTMLVTHRETRTLLFKMSRKTYYFDPETIESVLKEMVEGVCDGIDLVRERRKGGEA